MGIFRFFVCLFLVLSSSVSLISNSSVVSGGCYESTIFSPVPFMGNNGEVFELSDGSSWEVLYEYEYLYEYYPTVQVCPDLRTLIIGDKSLNIRSLDNNSLGPDVEPPQLESWEVSPTTINVDYAAATVTVIFRVTDSSGVVSPLITASHPSGQSTGFAAISRISGDEYDGIWEAEISVPAGSAPGEWDVSLFPLRDTLGNSGSFGPSFGYQSFFNVEFTAEDTDVEPPEDPVLGDQSDSIMTWDFDEDGNADALTSLMKMVMLML